MKVLLKAYTAMNLGDDMFITYICKRYPQVSFYIDCSDKYFIPFKQLINIHQFDNTFESIRFDLKIIIGGSLFMQSISTSINNKFFNDYQSLMVNSIPTYIIGVNFGPYESENFAKIYKEYFKKARYTVFRDEYSYNLFQDSNTSWAPDILFNYKLPTYKKEPTIAISCIKKNKRSGLPDYNENEYFKVLVSLIEHYCQMGYKTNLFAFCKLQEDDIAALEIFEMLSYNAKHSTNIIIYEGNINNFLMKFLKSIYVVGSRFHSIILALNAKIPVYPIAYNYKITHALDSYSFNGKYAHIQEVSDIGFRDFEVNRLNNCGIDLNCIRLDAKKHFELLDEILGGHNEKKPIIDSYTSL